MAVNADESPCEQSEDRRKIGSYLAMPESDDRSFP